MRLLEELFGMLKDMHNSYFAKFEEWSEICRIENEVVKLSNSTFLHSFKDVAYELTEFTGIPYAEYLNLAKQMLLEGKSKLDTMNYFDNLLFELLF